MDTGRWSCCSTSTRIAIEVFDPTKRDSWLSKLIGWVTRQTQKHCDGVIYLGDVLRQHAEARYGPAKRSAVIEVIADAKLFGGVERVRPRARASDEGVADEGVHSPFPLRIRYGGQLGHMHHAELLARCVAAGQKQVRGVAFDFFVSGAGVPKARPILQSAGIKLQPPSFDPDWRARMSDYPLSLVALSPGGATVCFPSKTFASLAAGQAILAICPRWSDLGRMIEEYEIGWVVDNGYMEAQRGTHAETPRRKDVCGEDAPALRDDDSVSIHANIGINPESLQLRPESDVIADFVETLKFITKDSEELNRRRQNAWNLAHKYYTDEWLYEKWMHELRS